MLILSSLYFTCLVLLFFVINSRLLITLILLEILTFFVLFTTSSLCFISSTFLTMLLFCVFVLESVVGLVGFLNLTHFSGSDYTSLSLFTQ